MAAWREQPGGRRSAADARRTASEATSRVVEGDQRLNWRRGILVGTMLISGLILIAIIAVLVLTAPIGDASACAATRRTRSAA